MKYAWIKAHRDELPIKTMCKVLKVSRSGFYKSLHEQPSNRTLRSHRIREQVKRLYEESHCNYGSYKISKAMNENEELENACRKTVAKAMQEMGLKSRVRKTFKPRTTEVDPTKKPAKNLLDQVFTAPAPNQKWVTDITYLATSGGWVSAKFHGRGFRLGPCRGFQQVVRVAVGFVDDGTGLKRDRTEHGPLFKALEAKPMIGG